MKVAFVLLDGELTGGQIVATELMAGLRRSGHEALAILPREGPLLERLGSEGIEVRLVPLSRSYRADQAFALARVVRGARVDLLDTHSLFVGNQLARMAARLARVPLVAHSHIDERYHPSPLVRTAQRLMEGLGESASATIAVSNALRELLVERGGDPRRIVVVHNGVRLGEQTRPPEEGRLRLLCVARLAPVKGQEILLEALAASTAGISVDFVGEDLERGGAYRAQLERRTDALGLSERVRFLGRRSDLPALLRASGALVLPSLAEGLPLVVLEAMAQARAVVATSVGGTPEAVLEGKTGLLVAPGDPASLATALELLHGDRALRTAYGEAGYQRVSELFSTERMVEHTLAVYLDVVSRARSAR